jgi:hypothetical protein
VNITVLDPLLSESDAAEVVRIWHDYGEYGQYSNEGFATTYAPELSQRYDASVNFVRSGGRFGRKEERSLLQARTNYFRETYAYDGDVFAPGIQAFRDSPRSKARRGSCTGAMSSFRPSFTPTSCYPARNSPCTPTCRNSVARAAGIFRSGCWW